MDDGLKDEKGKWDLGKIARECETELKGLGIPIGKSIEINVCRDKYVSGRLCEEWKGEFVLYIPNAYRNPKYKLDEIRTVICHQLLHSVHGCMNHGKTWEGYAEMADRECGCHIMEQAESRPELGVNWNTRNKRKGTEDSGRCCYFDYTDKLMAILEECSEELKSIGLQVGKVSEVRFVRCDSVYGWCREKGDGTYIVCISQKYGRDEADNYGLKGLICHELLHTCPEDDSNPYSGIHGPKWREMARKIERECGYRVMGQSYTDAVRKASESVMQRYACPKCGGYWDVYDEKDKKGLSGKDKIRCIWCGHKMNIVRAGEIDALGAVYSLLGECQDKLRIASIPIRGISGTGFVLGDSMAGLHDNWDGNYALDLPGIYRQQGNFDGTGLISYLYKELIRTCEGCWDCGVRWEEYVQKAETAFGFSIISEER